MSISICIPTYNRLSHLKRLLASIFDGFGNYPYEVIIADGGSTDGTLEYLRKLKRVTLIEQGKLTGSVKAFNACFRLAKCKYIFWPADDFVLIPRVIIKSCKLMDRYLEIGAVSPKIQETTLWNSPNVWHFPGDEFNNFIITSKTHIFRTSALKEINYFDETFRTYFIDGDSWLSVLKLGYATIFTREVGVIHTRFDDEIRRINDISEKNERIMREKHYYEKKWANLEAKLNEHLRLSPFKKYKRQFSNILRYYYMRISLQILQPIIRKNYALIHVLYDWLLEQCLVFKAEKYNYLKDFYLAQRLPKKVILAVSKARTTTNKHKK